MVDDAGELIWLKRLSSQPFMIHLIVKHLDSSKMNWIQCLHKNLLDCVQNAMPFSVRVKRIRMYFNTRPVEKKTAKGVKRKVMDDHLHFALFVLFTVGLTAHSHGHRKWNSCLSLGLGLGLGLQGWGFSLPVSSFPIGNFPISPNCSRMMAEKGL